MKNKNDKYTNDEEYRRKVKEYNKQSYHIKKQALIEASKQQQELNTKQKCDIINQQLELMN